MNSTISVSRAARLGRHAALYVLAVAAFSACRAEVATPAPPREEAIAKPALASPDAVLQRIKAAQGKPVVVNFWATWCPPCVEEMPELAKFHRDYVKRGVTFISVSADDPAAVASGKIEAFAQEHKLPFPVLVLDGADPDTVNKTLDVDVSSLPVTLAYGADGQVSEKWETTVTAKELGRAVDRLL